MRLLRQKIADVYIFVKRIPVKSKPTAADDQICKLFGYRALFRCRPQQAWKESQWYSETPAIGEICPHHAVVKFDGLS